MCTFVYGCMCLCMHMEDKRGHLMSSSDALEMVSMVLCLNLELVFSQLGWKPGSFRNPVFALRVGFTGVNGMLSLVHGSKISNSSPCNYAANIINTELFLTMLQPPKCHFWKLYMYWFVLVSTTKHKKMWSIHSKNVVSSQFWQVEIYDQDFKRFTSQWSLFSWFIDGIFLLCTHMTSCLCMRRETILVSFSLIKDTSSTGLGHCSQALI